MADTKSDQTKGEEEVPAKAGASHPEKETKPRSPGRPKGTRKPEPAKAKQGEKKSIKLKMKWMAYRNNPGVRWQAYGVDFQCPDVEKITGVSNHNVAVIPMPEIYVDSLIGSGSSIKEVKGKKLPELHLFNPEGESRLYGANTTLWVEYKNAHQATSLFINDDDWRRGDLVADSKEETE